jgi:hypothetical protein
MSHLFSWLNLFFPNIFKPKVHPKLRAIITYPMRCPVCHRSLHSSLASATWFTYRCRNTTCPIKFAIECDLKSGWMFRDIAQLSIAIFELDLSPSSSVIIKLNFNTNQIIFYQSKSLEMQMWSYYCELGKIQVENIPPLNFRDLDSIRRKVKTLLMFS